MEVKRVRSSGQSAICFQRNADKGLPLYPEEIVIEDVCYIIR